MKSNKLNFSNEFEKEKTSPCLLVSPSPGLPVSRSLLVLLIAFVLILSGCSELEKPTPEPYYAETPPPPKQEFRWSNGKMPKSFDPAKASAPPETDIVRAVFEGLTDTDPKNLRIVPAVATKWTASADNKVWSFDLRRNSKWSNGDSVTAEDFVRSWKRLAELGEKASHHELLNNIAGMREIKEKIKQELLDKEIAENDLLVKQSPDSDLPVFLKPPVADTFDQNEDTKPINPGQKSAPEPPTAGQKLKTDDKKMPETKFGVEAADKYILRVTLVKPDKDFPALVAHPIFRPIHADGKGIAGSGLNAEITTNGAFRIFSVGQDGVTLDRAENYWNKEAVLLERVRFVPAENAEKALEAYRTGQVDAVTNADFEPLALKLLTPYDDFRRTIHGALNFYEFNRKNKPFNDRRVRLALAISIERERLTDDEMDGATKPALSFSPFNQEGETKIKQDIERARKLLSEAGFANGENFPKIKLLVNRNNVQQRIANSVARMWEQNLHIETEVIVRNPEEFELIKKSGEYDLIRRGVVLPTSDEVANMTAIFAAENGEQGENFESDKNSGDDAEAKFLTGDKPKAEIEVAEPSKPDGNPPQIAGGEPVVPAPEVLSEQEKLILTEADALIELHAIPLYFPTSYSLVKPYVSGFEINTLDAPSLKGVRLDNDWQPKKTGGES